MLLPRLSFSWSTFRREGFSQVTDETLGKALHALCLTSVFHLSIFHSNTLIYFYSRCGHIIHARYLFDKLPVRNEASWNTIVSGYVRAGFYPEAFEFFRRNRGLGLCPNGVILASLVTACDRSACMANEGFQLHAIATKIGLIDLFVGTSLLHFYGAYGFVYLARKFFNEMPDKNVVSWTSLMVSYLDSNDPCEVVKLYITMRREGILCNENTFSTVISSCGLLENDWVGRQILGHVIKVGLKSNVSVGNSIISMFGNCGSAEEACYIFDQMDEHDTISWNAIISANANNGLYEESLDLFRQMRYMHNYLNSTTLSTLLTASGSLDGLRVGEALHGLLLKMGFKLNTCAYNTLLNMYSQAGRCEDAEQVFYEMSERDLITWNSMIAGCVMNRRCLYALKIFSEMLLLSKLMSYVTFTSAISACSSPEFSIQGKAVHALAVIAGLRDNLIISNALITMYGKLHLMLEARNVFDNVIKPDIVTCNALIGGYAENEEFGGAMKIFKLMREECISVNYITITSVLGACLTSNDLKGGASVHAHVVLSGYESDGYVQNSLISMYMRCGDQSSGTSIFDELDCKDVFAWNVIISGSAHYGHPEEALKLVVKMIASGAELDNFSFSGGLAAAANLAALEEGHLLHASVVKLGLNSDLYVVNALMDMYAKCGEINDVLSILPEPIDRSRMSWNVLISAYARHGYFQKAKEAFHKMLELGVKPDHVTFVALLSACSHGGLVEEGLAYFDSMEKEFGVSARIEHCVCVVDLLGRSGEFAEAEAFIEKMHVSPNDHIWRSLLAACKVHGNLELGKKAAENLLAFDPLDDSAYVLYSNICATSRRWDEMEKIRKKMGSIRKQPACSWVKLKDGVSSFGMGDKSHPQMKQIYAKLEEIKKIIKGAGYVPDTIFVFQDTDEEQKELNLWNHSERLALAFGLINIQVGMPIRVFKNLRVCGDCHSVYKIVSKMFDRKIILRDPYRFHHFEDGHCSCSDYW